MSKEFEQEAYRRTLELRQRSVRFPSKIWEQLSRIGKKSRLGISAIVRLAIDRNMDSNFDVKKYHEKERGEIMHPVLITVEQGKFVKKLAEENGMSVSAVIKAILNKELMD